MTIVHQMENIALNTSHQINLKNKNLSFCLNFPCWGAGEIQSYVSKIKIDSSGKPEENKMELPASCPVRD